MTPETDQIVAILTNLATGEIEPETAAQLLGLDIEGLETLVALHPELAEQAAQAAEERQTDPDQTLATAQRGLASIANTLASRVHTNPNALSVNELTSAGSLLEKLAGIAERRKAEIKAELTPEDSRAKDPRLPLVIHDRRANPKTGESRMAIYLIDIESPAWVDVTDPAFQEPAYDWLDHHMPLSPETGEPIRLTTLTEHAGFRYLDSKGRLHGGHL